MKKFTGVVLVILLCLGLMTGCGQSYDAQTSTVFVLKDGKIVSTDVETFDENTYDKAGLETYVKNAVDSYTKENGKNSVIFKELTVAEGNATLLLEYASAADYMKFNGIELYTGSVAEALAAGYSFDVEFGAIKDGKAVSCNVNDFLGSDYKVVIIKGNMNVQIPGKVLYVSADNTTYVDESTISVQDGTSLFGTVTGSEDTQGTESAQETIDGEATDESSVEDTQKDEDTAVDDDELLSAVSEDEEVVFEFEEEAADESEQTREFSEVYTYIIYK